MATQVEKTVEVDVPVRTVYDQWTQFEEFPQFMSGVDEVRQVGDSLTHWIAQIGGVRREWDAAILEQVPDSKVAWAATTGATNAGAVYFQSLGPSRTLVRLSLEYEPEGLVEKVGDFLNIVERQAEGDLERFKSFIEGRGTATGGWRGAVNEAGTVGSPGTDAASASRGDSGKAGVSGTAIAAGVAAAGAVVAGAAAVAGAKRTDDDEQVRTEPGFASTVPASQVEVPASTGVVGGVVAEEDFAATGRPIDDPIAVDEFGTANAGVSGGTTGIPLETPVDPIPGARTVDDDLDPRDPDSPKRPI